MFTGIVETTGVVRALRPTAAGLRLVVDAGRLPERPVRGASLSVNGVCQTVATDAFPLLEFDVVPETLRRTTLGRLRPGDLVNLEPSLRPSDRIEGHIVQGHVDGVARVTEVTEGGPEWLLGLELEDEEAGTYIIPKGSVAVDGVSLTVAECETASGARFRVALIPTTLERTTLGRRRPGDVVNIETDIHVRTIVTYLRRLAVREGPGITLDLLREHGFA